METVDKTLLDFSEIGYIAGAVLGDGALSIEHRPGGYRAFSIRLSSADREFVERFNRCLEIVIGHQYSLQVRQFREAKPSYSVNCRNKRLFYLIKDEWRQVLWLYPKEFIGAFFDAEGSIYRAGNGGGCYLSIRNTNKDILDGIVKVAAEKLKLLFWWKGVIRRSNRKDLYTIYTGGYSRCKFFLEEVGITIERKRLKLASILASYKRRPYKRRP